MITFKIKCIKIKNIKIFGGWNIIMVFNSVHGIYSCRSFSLLKAKAIAIGLPLLFANAFKSVKERQLLLSQ